MASKREIAINHIRHDFAKNGKDTGVATRYYIENRISYSEFQKAAKSGLNYFYTTNPDAR